MKIFEFRFNPDLKPDLLCEGFYGEPENLAEKKLGQLYLVAELKNALPQNAKLLAQLNQVLKKEYYASLGSSEQGIKKALKKANAFLSEKSKTGDVSWLGNLSAVVVSLADLQLNFSKDGSLKALLLRPGQVTDIGKALELEEFEPYPLKIFTNIISGKFLEQDKILIVSKEIFDFFQARGFLEKLSYITEEKGLRLFFKEKEEIFSLPANRASGICVLIFLNKELAGRNQLVFKKAAASFSLRQILLPLLKIYLPRPSLPRFSLPKASLPRRHFAWPNFTFSFDEKTKNNLLLISALVFLLLLGLAVSQIEKEKSQSRLREKFLEVQNKVVQAENQLALGKNNSANLLFQEAWFFLSPLVKKPSPFQKEAFGLSGKVKDSLYRLNRIDTRVPELLFDFAGQGFTPQKMILFGDALYFFNPFEKNLFKLTISPFKIEKINSGSIFNLAASNQSRQEIILFSRPNKISFFKDNRFQKEIVLEFPAAVNSLAEMKADSQSLYFLEKNSGKIIRFRQPLSINKNSPRWWLLPGEKRPLGAESFMGSDSGIYVLAKDNSLWRYLAGRLVKTIDLSVSLFPKPKAFTEVTGLFGLLALLEPEQKRVVIIDNGGLLVKQFENDQFASLKDAVFSSNGKNLYVLAGLKVFRLEI